MSDELAAQLVDRLSQLPVVPVDADLVLRAVAGSRAWEISLWDALTSAPPRSPDVRWS